jgi:hypothetical protein
MKLCIIFTRLSLLMSCLLSQVINAAVLTVDDLSFGTIAVVNNNSPSEISISSSGTSTITNHIRIILPGHRGEYVLSSYPAFTKLFTTVSVVAAQTTSTAPGSEQFTLVSVETPVSVTTDINGTATVFVGGTLRTSGNTGGQYYDTLYTASLELSVNY